MYHWRPRGRDAGPALLRDDGVRLAGPRLPDGQAVRGALLVDGLPVGAEQKALVSRRDLGQRGRRHRAGRVDDEEPQLVVETVRYDGDIDLGIPYCFAIPGVGECDYTIVSGYTILPNAGVREVTVSTNNRVTGVKYLDRESLKEGEVNGRVVVVSCACVQSVALLQMSTSRLYPQGLANSVNVYFSKSPTVVVEHEPNEEGAKAQRVAVPCEIAGQFYPESDVDWFQFEAKKGGTKVTLKHSKIPESQASSYEEGWHQYYFTPMKAYFAR